MKNIKQILGVSIGLLMFSPMADTYADSSEVVVDESVQQTKEEKPEIIELTLKEAIERALENNLEVKKSILDLKKAEVNFREGNYDIRANKKLLEDEKETSLDYLKMVTLLDFTNKFTYENSKVKDEIVRKKVADEVEELYFNLVQATKFVDANKTGVDLARRVKDISKVKLDLGLGIKQELLNSEISYEKSKESYDQSVKNLENAKMLFNTKLGLEILQKIDLVEELKYKEFNIEDVLSEEKTEEKDEKEVVVEIKDEVKLAVSKALKNRNEIKLAEFNLELESMKMDIVKKEYPSITFMYRQQEVDLDKAKKILEDAKDGIEMEVRSSYKELYEKQSEISSSKMNSDLAKEGLRIVKANHDLGMATLLDVDSAKAKSEQAELALSNAILKYNLEVLKFNAMTGIGRSTGGM